MSGFQKYQFQELTAGKPEAPSDVRPYQEPRFEHHVNADSVDRVHKKKEAFQLDHHVAGHLGIEERQRKAEEERVRKEIERRWEQTAEKAEVAGYTKGLEDGKLEAYQAEMPRIRERLEKFDHMLQELDKFRERIFVANEGFLMDLIGQIAGMIVLKEVSVDREYIHRLVISLLHQLGTKEDLKIYVSETDFANVEVLRAAVEKEFGKLTNSSFEFSPEIPVGGCKIETRFGVVDASVQAQIENVTKALKG